MSSRRCPPEALPRALEKAERYRLLNEPSEAESICLDVLDVEPDNQEALVTLLLALTDQFDTDAVVRRRRPQDDRTDGRRVRARVLHRHRLRTAGEGAAPPRAPGFGPRVYGWLRDAMIWYEKAEAIRPTGNDDAVLRWNACARLLMRDQHLVPAIEERGEPLLLE